MSVTRTILLIVSVAGVVCACASEEHAPSEADVPDAPTIPPIPLPPNIPKDALPLLQQQVRRALAADYDSRCPGGMKAAARNRGSQRGIAAETTRAPPTPWDGPKVSIQSPKPNQRLSLAEGLYLDAMTWGSEIVWFSDLDGELGREAMTQVPASCLTPGTHRIEARQMKGSEIVALGSVVVIVQTALEALEESRRTPDLRPEIERGWVLRGEKQTVDLKVRNYGGGTARAMTLVVRGEALAAAEGTGWQCGWRRVNDQRRRGTPSRELQCEYDRDLPGAQVSLPLHLRFRKGSRYQSPPGQLWVSARVKVLGEMYTDDNHAGFAVQVLRAPPIRERLMERPFEYITLERDPDFGSRPPRRRLLHAGPMLVRVDEVRAEPKQNAVLELYASPQLAIPNVPRDLSTSRVRLQFDAVVGEDGRSLVFGANAAELGAVVPEDHAYRKSLVLDAGVHAWDVAAIEGQVDVDIPVRVDRVRIDKPARGVRLKRHGVTLAVTTKKADSISFRLSGDTNRVLEIRALNEQGQPLVPSKKRRTLWDPGSHTLQVRGHIGALEVFLAEELKTFTFPFSLHPTPKRGAADTSALDQVFEPYSMATFKREYEEQARKDVLAYVASGRYVTRKGPVLATQLASVFFLELVRVNQQGALMPGVRINLPRLPNLQYTFGQLIFQIDYVHLRDGRIVSPTTVAQTRESPGTHDDLAFKLPAKHSEPAWATYVWSPGLSGPRKASHGWVSLPLGLEERDDITMLEGRLIYRVPKAIRWHAFQSANPGERIQTPEFEAKLVSVGKQGTTVEVDHGGDRVIALYWFDDQNPGTGILRPESFPMVPRSHWTHAFTNVKRANVAVAIGKEFESVEYPVRLKIPQP